MALHPSFGALKKDANSSASKRPPQIRQRLQYLRSIQILIPRIFGLVHQLQHRLQILKITLKRLDRKYLRLQSIRTQQSPTEPPPDRPKNSPQPSAPQNPQSPPVLPPRQRKLQMCPARCTIASISDRISGVISCIATKKTQPPPK